MFIGSKLEYALKVLIELACQEKEELIPSRSIAQACDIPQNYIPQIISALSKRGWIESSRGPSGGIRLSTSSHEITVKDVVEALDNRLIVKECLFSHKLCQQSQSCPLFPLWNKIQDRVTEVIEDTTIADLARDKARLEKETIK